MKIGDFNTNFLEPSLKDVLCLVHFAFDRGLASFDMFLKHSYALELSFQFEHHTIAVE